VRCHAAIARVQQLWTLAQAVFYGLSLGSVLLLAAAGLAITFGVIGVINMAHGEMVMPAAYTTYVVHQVLQSYMPSWFGASLFIAIPLAFVVSGVVGISQAAERFYRALPDDPPAHLRTRITVADGAAAEWLPQEAILFDRAAPRLDVLSGRYASTGWRPMAPWISARIS
jgi:Branched-chain amino acid transport system / permease component/UreD urease accessory protein